MSADFFRRVPVESLAREAAWFDKAALNKFLWHRISAGNGLNKLEREQARELVRKRIAEIRATSQRSESASPTAQFTDRELLAAIREIEAEVRKIDKSRGEYSGFPIGAEFSPAALWLLNQLGRPSCLLAIWCAPSEKLCKKCEWLFRLYSAVGRQEAQGTMLELQRELKLISV